MSEFTEKHLEYVQREAAKNMDFHLANMDNLQKEANTTLNFLYLFISASFSATIKLFLGVGHPILKISFIFVSLYLALTTIYLVVKCLMARRVDAPANEPENLLKTGLSSNDVQFFELKKLHNRIKKNRERNDTTAFHLNAVRWLICLTPIFFGAIVGLAWFVRTVFFGC